MLRLYILLGVGYGGVTGGEGAGSGFSRLDGSSSPTSWRVFAIMERVDKKKQHIIPKAYLRAWSDPAAPQGKGGFIWVIQRVTLEKALKSPASCFCDEDRYTIQSGGNRNLAVENALAVVEGWFGTAQKMLMADRQLSPENVVHVAFFAAAMMSRTQHFPEKIGGMLRTIQRQAARLAAKAGTPPSLSDTIERELPDIDGTTVRSGLIEFVQIIIRMNLFVLVTDDEAGFVTGDNPCAVCVPGDPRPFLGHPDVEFTLPLSPRHLAMYSWKVPTKMPSNLNRAKVDEVNSRTVAACRKEFVSWKGTVRSEWIAGR